VGVTIDEGNNGSGSGSMSLEELKSKKEALARKLEYATFRLEDSEKGAQKALDLYQDTTSDLQKVDFDIEVVRRELMEVQSHRDTVANHI
jgi:exonuclease VII small subunit